jgi:outer membrane protein assembly factor BamD (BamD/ComL family)
MRIRFSFLTFMLGFMAVAMGQSRMPQENVPKNGPKATLVREANLYVQADESSDRVSVITPGREMVIVERSGKWLRVFANTDVPESREADMPTLEQDQTVTPLSGWMVDKGVIDVNTPHGDEILFGEAVSAENAASESHPPPRAAQDARLLYRRVVEMFPKSSLTPEAMWRAADIRWQLQKADASTLPSAHEKENYLRQQMDENEIKAIEKYFPHTKWAAFAAYDQIDNKLCGDWQGAEKCPEKEAETYVKYAEDYPDSPRAPEALYKAAWRLAAAGDMWTADNDGKRAQEDRGHATDLAGKLQAKYPDSVYAAQAADLIYKLQTGIVVYGSDRE